MRLLAVVFSVAPVTLLAHDAVFRSTVQPVSIWDVLAVCILGLLGALYAGGTWQMGLRGAKQRRAERIAFWCGWVVMLAAVLPPLDSLAAQRFAAHMLQHELLMIVGVPLVIAGRPMATCLWALPAVLRRDAARMFQRDTPIGAFWRLVTAPAAAWMLHGVVVWVWHVPALYELAVLNEGIHAIQHAMFVGTSALFWWGLVYGRYGRTGYGASVFYVFTTAVHTGILGALFTLGTSPFYKIYVERAPDPLGDQQLAGLVMWIPAGFVLTAAGIGLFAAWLGEADRRSRGAALLVVLACLGAGASGREPICEARHSGHQAE